VLYETLHDLLTTGDRGLHAVLDECWATRPAISNPHLVTLLGIGIREISLRSLDVGRLFDGDEDRDKRAEILRKALADDADALTAVVSNSSNSFTGARRFLVPQLLIGEFAARRGLTDVRFLDLGTGIGLMPRQLNNKTVFDRFAADLSIPAQLRYRPIPLSARHGIDMSPLPTLDWVRACFGPSPYYSDRYRELLWSLDETADVADHVTVDALNLLDREQLAEYIRAHRFNAVCCSFVLYQYDPELRTRIVENIVHSMSGPGVFLSMEPSHGLLRQGCTVTAYLARVPEPLHVADVTDGHFLGAVHAGPDLARFLQS
ncbi:MAG: hypothetical protein HOV83_06065, partial [Catenulispora sp.]|nr:hypothetical protein [Catenulispora sp.]